MSSINFATREITCKIVYYGPGLSGKTTNLQVVHQKIPLPKRSEMVSLATDSDRTLFFDFLPLDLGHIKGFQTKFQLYTVPGQVYYNSTRKMVLRGVDGVVFVADSSKDRLAENLESLQNLQQNLREYGMKLEELPFVLQYNKRDLPKPEIFTIQEMNEKFNVWNVQAFPAAAYQAKGVITTLKAISRIVIEDFNKRQSGVGKKPLAPSPLPVSPVENTPPVNGSTLPEVSVVEQAPVSSAETPKSSNLALENTNPYGQSSSTPSVSDASPLLDPGPASVPPPPLEEPKNDGLYVDGVELKPFVPKKKDN